MGSSDLFKFTPFEWTMSNEFLGSVIEFAIRLCCTGQVDTERFNTAIVSALKQQPLLQANASIGPTHSSSYWQAAADPAPVIRWLDGKPAIGRAALEDFQPINLEREIGFRFYGWQFQIDGQPQTEMRFIFQHACCDGKGAVSFIEDVLCQYKLLKEGTCSALPKFDGNRILLRDQHTLRSYPLADRIWRTFVVRPRRAANMLLTRPVSMHCTTNDSPDVSAMVARQCSVTLSQEATEKIGAYAHSLGATTNLILARELFHVLGDYLKTNSTDANKSLTSSLVRILIPYSLRNERHQFMPAANCVSMAYLETKLDSLCQESQESSPLLEDLMEQFAFIEKWQLQYAWIEAIRAYARLWPLIGLLKRGREKSVGRPVGRQVATTVLSNLGRVLSGGCLPNCKGKIVVDSLEIETVHLILPCTDKLSVNFAVNFYRDCLTLDISYLPSMVTRETAQDLLDSWRCRILDTVERGSP